MAIGNPAQAAEMGRALASLLAGNGTTRGLWMTRDRGGVTFWILTDPIDLASQESLYERSASLYDRFPGVEFDVHVLNPEWFENGDALSTLPSDAEPITLSPS